jgi:hypothetical protein
MIWNPSPSTGGTPVSPNTSLQYNNGGSFGGTKILYTLPAGVPTLTVSPQSVSNTNGLTFFLNGSNGNGTGKGGNINIDAGNNQSATSTGAQIFLAGAEVPSTSTFVGATSSTGNGGSIEFIGGFAGGASGNGGNISFQPGSESGTGAPGSLILINPDTGQGAVFDTNSLSGGNKTFTFPNQTGILVSTPNPGANTIYVWDNTDGLPKNAIIGSGLTYTHSTHTLSAPASISIGETVTSGTTGSVLYVGSGPVLAQDNANFFWDATNHRLGIGTTSPSFPLSVSGDYNNNAVGPLILTNKSSTLGVSVTLDATGGGGTGHQFSLTSTGSGSFFGAGAFTFIDSTRAAYIMTIGATGNINLGDTGNFTTIIPGFSGIGPALPAGTLWDVHQQGFSVGSESTSAIVSLFYYNGSTFYSALRYTGVASGFTNLLLVPDGGNVIIGSASAGASPLAVHGLPTSTAGLSTGDVWVDTTGGLNILKIV